MRDETMPRYILWVNEHQFYSGIKTLAQGLEAMAAFGGTLYEPMTRTTAEPSVQETQSNG